MEPRVHIVTLAVDDLERALTFYRDGLCFESSGIVASDLRDDSSGAEGAIAMFKLHGGLTLSVYPRAELAKDAGVPLGPGKSGEFSIGQVVEGRAQVDAVLASAEAAGATVLGKPRDRPWGIYSGYFHDLDGHLWEIIHNPELDLEPS